MSLNVIKYLWIFILILYCLLGYYLSKHKKYSLTIIYIIGMLFISVIYLKTIFSSPYIYEGFKALNLCGLIIITNFVLLPDSDKGTDNISKIFMIIDTFYFARKNKTSLFYLCLFTFITLISDYLDNIFNTRLFYIIAPIFIITGTYIYVKDIKARKKQKENERV